MLKMARLASFWHSKLQQVKPCQKPVEFEQRMQKERDDWGQNKMGSF